jgi:hypothetical protein
MQYVIVKVRLSYATTGVFAEVMGDSEGKPFDSLREAEIVAASYKRLGVVYAQYDYRVIPILSS